MRLIVLRYDSACVICRTPLVAKTQAWWHAAAKEVTCVQCRPASSSVAVRFEAGRSAQRTADRKRAREHSEWEEANLLKKARIVWRNEPSKAGTWSRGAEGERIVGGLLDRLEAEGVIVALHDIRIPQTTANVDHVAVAPSGVHIIYAKYYKNAQIAVVDRGGWFSTDLQLRVTGRNRTNLVQKLSKQILTVDSQLHDTPLPTPVTAVLCFVDALWGVFKKEYTLNGVRIVPPPRLERLLRREGPLTADHVRMVGDRLRERLRPA